MFMLRFTAPGADEIMTTSSTSEDPTASGTFISDDSGMAVFEFRQIDRMVGLSGISIAKTCVGKNLFLCI